MPAGYMDRLKTFEPEVVFDGALIRSQEDWIRAGELVFQAPTSYEVPGTALRDVLDPQWYSRIGVRTTQDGVMPYLRFVIRQKGKIRLGASPVPTVTHASCQTVR